jgi:hypothetical protein
MFYPPHHVTVSISTAPDALHSVINLPVRSLRVHPQRSAHFIQEETTPISHCEIPHSAGAHFFGEETIQASLCEYLHSAPRTSFRKKLPPTQSLRVVLAKQSHRVPYEGIASAKFASQ